MAKIGIEAQRLFRSKKHGMEVVALETLRELQKADKRNSYEIFVADDEDRCLTSSDNFKVNVLTPKFYPVWEQFLLPKEVRGADIDLLHCTANTAPLNFKGDLIITIHDLIFMDSLELNASAYQVFGNLYRRLIVPRVARKAKVIVTVSEYSKKIISEKLKIDPERIRVIHNGVSPVFKKLEKDERFSEFRQKYDLPENYILHFGNTAPRKNTVTVLKAYNLYRERAVSPMKLVVAGCAPEVVHSTCKKHGLEKLLPHLTLPGYVRADELPLLYNQATVFLYPSLNEGFGLPVIESMSCGTPVITSDSSCLPEIAGDAALLVDPLDPSQIAASLENISKPDIFTRCVERGFQNAKRFSWQQTAEKTRKLYEEVVQLPN